MAKVQQSSADRLMFTDDFKAQLHAALDQMLDVHDKEIRAAIDESEEKKLPLNFVVKLDCSESEPSCTVDLRFTPRTVTDSRTIRVTDPNQGEFHVMTPAQMEAEAAAQRAKRAKEKAQNAAEEKDGAQSHGESGDGEGSETQKPKRRSRKTAE